MSLRMTKFVGVVVIVCCYLELVKGKWEKIPKKGIFTHPNHIVNSQEGYTSYKCINLFSCLSSKTKCIILYF